jgi:hypothetical protein
VPSAFLIKLLLDFSLYLDITVGMVFWYLLNGKST